MAELPARLENAGDADVWWPAVSKALRLIQASSTDHPLRAGERRASRFNANGRYANHALVVDALNNPERAGLVRPSWPIDPAGGELPAISAPEQGWGSLGPQETFYVAQNGMEAARRVVGARLLAADESAAGAARRRADADVARYTTYAQQADDAVKASSAGWLPQLAAATQPAAPAAPTVVKLRS